MTFSRSTIVAVRKRLIASRVLRDSSMLLVGNWFNLVISIITSVLLARMLGSESFGLVTLAIAAVNFVIQFIDAQTDEALIRFMGQALAKGERDEALTFFYVAVLTDVGVAALALTVVLLVVPPIIGQYPDGEMLRHLVGIFLVTTPFTILHSNFEAVLKTFKRFRLSSTISIVTNLISLPLMVLLATQGVVAVVWGYVIVTLIRFTFLSGAALWLLRHNLADARGRDYRSTWRRLMPFVFHTSFMGSLKSIASNIDTLLLGALAGTSAVSFYAIARSALTLIALPIVPVTTVIYPMMNEAWALKNLERVKYLIRRYMLLCAVISVSLALGVFLLADFLVQLVYGVDYLPVANLVRIMCIGTVLECVTGWVRTAALSDGKPQLVTFTGVIASLIFIPLDALLIYQFGATGSALGYVSAVLMMVSFNAVYVLPRLGLSDVFWSGRKAVRG